MRLRSRSAAAAAVLMLLAVVPLQAIAETFKVTDIRVEGLQRIAAGTVFNYLPVRPGETFDTANTGEVIRALVRRVHG